VNLVEEGYEVAFRIGTLNLNPYRISGALAAVPSAVSRGSAEDHEVATIHRCRNGKVRLSKTHVVKKLSAALGTGA